MKKTIYASAILSLAIVHPVAHAQPVDPGTVTSKIREKLSHEMSERDAGYVPSDQRNTDVQQPPPDNGGIRLSKTLSWAGDGSSISTDAILGLKLGMPIDQATQILSGICKSRPNIQYTSLTSSYRGVSEVSQNFPSMASCLLGPVTVQFTPPVAGSAVDKITRNENYNSADIAPSFSDLKADIQSKYAVPILPVNGYYTSQTELISTQDGHLLPPVNRLYLSPDDPSDPRQTAQLYIDIQVFNQNPGRVNSMQFILEDLRLERQTSAEVLKQMNASVDAKLASSVKPSL